MTEAELKEALNAQIKSMELLIRDVKDIKYTLIGNEFNNHRGLVHDFNEYKEKTDIKIEEIKKEVQGLKDYRTGMKWGIGILTFITTSTIFLKAKEGLIWIWQELNK